MIEHEGVGLVDEHRDPKQRRVPCVINMTVCEKDCLEAQSFFFKDAGDNLVCSHAGIDEAGTLRGIVNNDVAIRLERTRRKSENSQCSTSPADVALAC